MRAGFRLFILLLLATRPAPAQVVLSAPINSNQFPADTTHIAAYTPYIDTSLQFVNCGLALNSTAPDFTVFDSNGASTQLSTMCSNGRPTLLVSISYSCPASRHSMGYVLPDIIALYGQQINICLVYTLEAHPVGPDFSPFADTVWTLQLNYDDSILIPQEQTYLQRKTKAALFRSNLGVSVPVYIDGPGNEYWSTFGPAPNNAYLITTTGTVYQKYGWFDKSRTDIIADIGTMLSTTSVNAIVPETKVSLAPNPSSGITNLVVSNESYYSYKLVDTSGRIIRTQEHVSGLTSLDLSAFESGMYFVQVETASGKKYTLPCVRE